MTKKNRKGGRKLAKTLGNYKAPSKAAVRALDKFIESRLPNVYVDPNDRLVNEMAGKALIGLDNARAGQIAVALDISYNAARTLIADLIDYAGDDMNIAHNAARVLAEKLFARDGKLNGTPRTGTARVCDVKDDTQILADNLGLSRSEIASTLDAVMGIRSGKPKSAEESARVLAHATKILGPGKNGELPFPRMMGETNIEYQNALKLHYAKALTDEQIANRKARAAKPDTPLNGKADVDTIETRLAADYERTWIRDGIDGEPELDGPDFHESHGPESTRGDYYGMDKRAEREASAAENSCLAIEAFRRDTPENIDTATITPIIAKIPAPPKKGYGGVFDDTYLAHEFSDDEIDAFAMRWNLVANDDSQLAWNDACEILDTHYPGEYVFMAKQFTQDAFDRRISTNPPNDNESAALRLGKGVGAPKTKIQPYGRF